MGSKMMYIETVIIVIDRDVNRASVLTYKVHYTQYRVLHIAAAVGVYTRCLTPVYTL